MVEKKLRLIGFLICPRLTGKFCETLQDRESMLYSREFLNIFAKKKKILLKSTSKCEYKKSCTLYTTSRNLLDLHEI